MNNNTTQNYWLTSLDTAIDMSWTHLQLETMTEDGEMVVLAEEIWKRNDKGEWELTEIVHGDAYNTFAYMNSPYAQQLIDAANEQEDEPYFFAA